MPIMKSDMTLLRLRVFTETAWVFSQVYLELEKQDLDCWWCHPIGNSSNGMTRIRRRHPRIHRQNHYWAHNRKKSSITLSELTFKASFPRPLFSNMVSSVEWPNTNDVGESGKRKPADLYLMTVALKDFYCISFMNYSLLRYIYSHFIRNYAQRLFEIYYSYHGIIVVLCGGTRTYRQDILTWTQGNKIQIDLPIVFFL